MGGGSERGEGKEDDSHPPSLSPPPTRVGGGDLEKEILPRLSFHGVKILVGEEIGGEGVLNFALPLQFKDYTFALYAVVLPAL